MANFSPNECAIIAKNPLGNSLDYLHDSLQKIEQNYEPHSYFQHDAVDSPDSDPRKALSRLLSTLQVHEVAFNLRSKTKSENIASELSTLFKRVQNSDFSYEHYRTLSQLVIKHAPDIDIWNAVLDLIVTVSQSTPPTGIPLSFDCTPITSSSASQQTAEQTADLVEARIFNERKSCTYRNVGGFFSKYFEGKDWTARTKEIYRTVQDRHAGGRWTDFPDLPVENAVLKWLFRFQEEFLSDAKGVYYTSESKDLTGGEARRQLDVFIKRKSIVSRTLHNWKDVQVIGEHKTSNKQDFKHLLLQLGRYMRDVFTAQPTRHFIHGFFLYGTTMELWVFDRSGPYSSGEFDIHKEPEVFIRAIAGYAMMSDEELGLDTFVEREGEDRFITLTEDMTGKEKRLQLERDPIVIQRAIVCRGTNCYRSKDSEYVVKFSWTSDKRQPEARFLRLAREKGVKGVAKLLGYHCITSIDKMRDGLTFPASHHFRNTSPSASGKRKSTGHEATSSKRSKSSGQRSTPGEEYEASQRVENTQGISLYARSDAPFDNRLLNCLVISPAGEAIGKFDSIPTLLTALRDAIKAHRSLYIQGRSLHRDISENNIIITDPEKADGFTGILIDLELVKEVGSGRSGARHQTGTMEFMAIEVLRRVSHTYRHDLESFFYVLLWMCARRAWEREFQCKWAHRPKRDILRKWYTGDFDDIADAKKSYMHVDEFDKILDEFPLAFNPVKPLCENIRGILFPTVEGGALFTGTTSNPPEMLYDPIIQAFDNAIADM
ncbi:hypothetical protein ABVK25_011342 [Lepraria finkii]|uniref:Protein kinase domain-containing protein n=1 Tax=Lepraria finkii TaxID=1340010 RepID=A0ABR4ASG5_9LECA